jgi:hypothetical protein
MPWGGDDTRAHLYEVDRRQRRRPLERFPIIHTATVLLPWLRKLQLIARAPHLARKVTSGHPAERGVFHITTAPRNSCLVVMS